MFIKIKINNIKNMLVILSSFLMIFLMAIPVYATKNVERRFDEIEVIGRVVEKYLVNDGSYIYFDYEKADTNICFHKMLILKYFFK